MRNVAKAWVGYLEHATNDLLGVFTANIGKGGYTIFSVIIQRYYRWRNFSGLAWCATFVHAVCLEAYGVDKARKLVGKPHPGTRVLARRLKRQGRLKGREYTPQPNDLIFLQNGDGRISHCGIVDHVEGDIIVSIEGNTHDPTGRFVCGDGGAVAIRRREADHRAIMGYGQMNLSSKEERQ